MLAKTSLLQSQEMLAKIGRKDRSLLKCMIQHYEIVQSLQIERDYLKNYKRVNLSTGSWFRWCNSRLWTDTIMDQTFGVLEGESVFLCGRDVNARVQKADCGSQPPRLPPMTPSSWCLYSWVSPISHCIRVCLWMWQKWWHTTSKAKS